MLLTQSEMLLGKGNLVASPAAIDSNNYFTWNANTAACSEKVSRILALLHYTSFEWTMSTAIIGWINRRRFCLQKGGSQEHRCCRFVNKAENIELSTAGKSEYARVLGPYHSPNRVHTKMWPAGRPAVHTAAGTWNAELWIVFGSLYRTVDIS